MAKLGSQNSKNIITNGVTKALKPRRVKDLKSARSLLGSLIYHYQIGTISENRARALAYLLIQFSNLVKTEKLEEIEIRLDQIEEAI